MTHPCPYCSGDGTCVVHIAHTDKPHTMEVLPCSFCDGTGEVPPERLAAYQRGRTIRESRILRGVSLREEAKRLGITAVELSRIERGEGSLPD
jgi:hypothetical protein